ncbi:MerR family transcriptional regulator [Micromonospora profundi]|uniref:MerR family transcriptional regulator n=1 Tax=Micromonospora profundi TaxID=1420889 RepID=A0AAJ6HP20_9ACTN|nr:MULTISPECIES: MerR family transcriptional regulator [Micromonospora]KOX04881.1 MerR family transcriptional regulator [Micromonospora sp. NRRL B-16802]NJC12292.1 DNA-binding transcriptional MerR regulator/effector-binding domain-containing protein [Micromonospora profundi]WLS44151.1 MerR family transcriptional regulator [Micromonospora profundi]
MFTIGDFARLGRVSVRMLRHYDSIGLLRPASVDPHTGYRFYRADQLRRLNRVIALKDLGLTLDQVRAILDDAVDVAELRGMLRLRRSQLAEQLAADTARLTAVEARLRMIESEGRMTTQDVVLKEIAPVRLAELTAVAPSYQAEDIGPVIQPLYPELFGRLSAAGVTPTGPAIAWYEPADPEGDAVVVHAGVIVDAEPSATFDVTMRELPGLRSAATIIHHGAMDDVESSMQTLARWIDENGYRTDGFARELYLEYCPDTPEKGITELQLAVYRD